MCSSHYSYRSRDSDINGVVLDGLTLELKVCISRFCFIDVVMLQCFLHWPDTSETRTPMSLSCAHYWYLFFFSILLTKERKGLKCSCSNWSLFCYRSILKSKSTRVLLLPTETESFNQNIESEQSCTLPKITHFSVCFSKPHPLLFKHW